MCQVPGSRSSASPWCLYFGSANIAAAPEFLLLHPSFVYLGLGFVFPLACVGGFQCNTALRVSNIANFDLILAAFTVQ